MSYYLESSPGNWLLFAAIAPVLVGAARLAAEEPARAPSPRLEFAEKQVAGGADDLMIVRHIKIAGSNREIGKKLAEIGKTRHAATPERADRVALQARKDFYRRNYPNHWERCAGAAEAFGLTFETTDQDTTVLPVNLGTLPGCSTVYYPPTYTSSGHATLSRNYDFSTATFAEIIGQPPQPGARAMTADVYVIEMYPDKGHPALYVCSYDLLGGCLDGVNSRGLTVALLAIDEGQKVREPAVAMQAGLSEIEVTRFLLDTCATVDEAKTALMATKQYYGMIPCHYIIGDRSGKSFIWEYSGGHNREYITDGAGQPQIITNHPVFKYKAMDEFPTEEPGPGSFYRYRRLSEEIAKIGAKHSVENMKDTNACVRASAPAPATGRKPNRTLWHSLYDSTDLSLQVDFYLGEDPAAPSGQKRSGYLTFGLPK